jgi:PIN domain nuclease of toxin-antitoxin system
MTLLLDTHTLFWAVEEPTTPHQKDPFDRLMITQALVDGVSIVSVDVIFDSYGVNHIW